jgi:hypothetical protein
MLQGIFVCSANLQEGDSVAVWVDLDDHRKATKEVDAVKTALPSGTQRLEDKEARDEARKKKRAEDKANQEGAVLRGSALHNYRGRRLKLGYY